MAQVALLRPCDRQHLEALGLHGSPPPKDMRNVLQFYDLSSNEEYVLDPSVDNLRMGLGWDRGADVDASAAMFTSDRSLVDMVWWKQLASICRSVRHSGDDLTGEGDGYDETIFVDLSSLPWNVHYIVFSVSIFTFGLTFDNVRRAFVDMINASPGFKSKVMCSYQLSGMRGNAMLMGMLVRRGAYWNFKALGLPATGRTIKETVMDRKNLECLHQTYSYAPMRRRVEAWVVRGENLVARDAATIFKAATSDPYYIIKFKSRKRKSEYVPKTLDPAWKLMPFDLGALVESEQAVLEITLYDYDALSADDFMGKVEIPGSMLFNCGIGTHEFWFDLGATKEHPFSANTNLGKIQVKFEITQI